MEPDIIGLGICMNDTADNMLAGMVLHQVKTIVPVNAACHLCAGGQRFSGGMQNDTIFDMGIGYSDIIQRTDISGLSAAFRIKSSPIQYHIPVVSAAWLTG